MRVTPISLNLCHAPANAGFADLCQIARFSITVRCKDMHYSNLSVLITPTVRSLSLVNRCVCINSVYHALIIFVLNRGSIGNSLSTLRSKIKHFLCLFHPSYPTSSYKLPSCHYTKHRSQSNRSFLHIKRAARRTKLTLFPREGPDHRVFCTQPYPVFPEETVFTV
ncbi:hypothetical protein H5410_054650 [Solanum commersonii]|uniref:Uncharacterized protein n=1 Tax=Solanum commersonii TaxID=4109 RepID=A0A9J5WH04_SOLCO|nr:hypothetical protein H5410_054650 [Solanum commersonii]